MSVSYSASTALSPSHYKLVQSIEAYTSSAGVNDIIVREVNRIKLKWSTSSKPLSYSTISHDLVLLLYCYSQIQPASNSDAGPSRGFVHKLRRTHFEFCLVEAVKLAGSASGSTASGAKLSERRIGYQACSTFFPPFPEPYPLKLMMVNTIRSPFTSAHPDFPQDLYAPYPQRDAIQAAEARYKMGLRAIISEGTRSNELGPAVRDRLEELLKDMKVSTSIRILALKALLSLDQISEDENFISESTQSVIVALISTSTFVQPAALHEKRHLHVPTQSVSASRLKDGQLQAQPVPPHPRLLAALLRTQLRSPRLHPGLPAEGVQSNRSELWLRILVLLCDGAFGTGGGTIPLGMVLLKVIEEEMSEVDDSEVQRLVLQGVLNYIDTFAEQIEVSRLHQALLSSSLRSCATLSHHTFASLASKRSQTLLTVLEIIRKQIGSMDLNTKYAGIVNLGCIPPEIWTGKIGDTEESWKEDDWKNIMRGLEGRDAEIRKTTIKLLHRVDSLLVETYTNKLLINLGSGHSISSENQRDQATQTTVSMILEASEIVDLTAVSWIRRLDSITNAIGPSTVKVLEAMVLRTVDRFGASQEELKTEFASGLLAKVDLWIGDLSWGLMVAATFGVSKMSPEIRTEEALLIANWLDQKHHQVSLEYLHSLQEPFLLALLRLYSQLSPSARDQLYSKVQTASRFADPATSQALFELFAQCHTTSEGQAALLSARGSTLPEFFISLQSCLKSSNGSSIPSSVASSTSGSTKPLSYGAYKAPISPTASSSKLNMSHSFAKDRMRSERKARERERERKDRGGKGDGGRMSESLMTGGALALVVGEREGRGPLDDDSDSDDESRSQTGSNHREDSITPLGGPSRSHQGSPPSDLLIELEVDPFHIA